MTLSTAQWRRVAGLDQNTRIGKKMELDKVEIVAIDKSELTGLYSELRELSEGRGAHRAAAETAINALFEILGEPGAGDE